MATVSQFAAPREGEASSSQEPPNLATASLSAAPRRGKASYGSAHDATPLGQCRNSQPPGTARPHYVLRMPPPRWGSQEPTKVASVSQSAAPRGPPDWHQTAQKGPWRGARWPRDQRLPQECPRWAQDISSTAQRGPQEGPKAAQEALKPAQGTSKMALEAPKTAPNRPKILRRSRTQQASKRIQDGLQTAGAGPEALQ